MPARQLQSATDRVLGKLRHIKTRYLWLQERVSAKDLRLTKELGTANPADMLTKNLAKADLDKHIEFSGLIICTGRAYGSLHINALLFSDCSLVGARIARAIRSAAGSYVVMDSSKVGLCPLRPRGGASTYN